MAPALVAAVIAGTAVLYVSRYKTHRKITYFRRHSWRHVATDLARVAEATAVAVVM